MHSMSLSVLARSMLLLGSIVSVAVAENTPRLMQVKHEVARAALQAQGLSQQTPILAQSKRAQRTSSRAPVPEQDKVAKSSITLQAPAELIELIARGRAAARAPGPDDPAVNVALALLEDGFEGAFPGPWIVFDNDGPTNGEITWGKTTFRASGGSASAWCAGGGADALSPPGPYEENMMAWLVAGPFDLSDAASATLDFEIWLETESGFDTFTWLASEDGGSFSGYSMSGASGAFLPGDLDLTNVPNLGDLTKPSNTAVWIAFVFNSDETVNFEGCYLDNVSLVKATSVSGTDLVFHAIDAIDGVFAPGDTTEVIYDVENIGTEMTNVEFDLYLSTDSVITSADTLLDSYSLGSIASGQRHVFIAHPDPLTTIPIVGNGMYYIGGILADDGNNSNNVAVDGTPIQIDNTASPPADLDNGLVQGPGGVWQHGEAFSVVSIAGNLGGRSTSSFRNRIHLSTDSSITGADRLLNPSRSELFFFGLPPEVGVFLVEPIDPIPGDATDGLYTIGTILEPTVAESVSNNHTNFDLLKIKVSNEPEASVEPNTLEFFEPAPEPDALQASFDSYLDSAQVMSDSRYPELLAIANTQGRINVIVGLNMPFDLDSTLGLFNADRQRLDIQDVGTQLLSSLQGLDVHQSRRYQFIPFMALEVSAQGLAALRASSLVSTIEEDLTAKPYMASSNPVIGSPTAWAEGFNGAGQAVAILDTGVDSSHSWFTTEPPTEGGPLGDVFPTAIFSKVVAEGCFSTSSGDWVSACPGEASSATGPGTGVPCDLAVPGCDHGTHVAGTAAGYDGTGPDFGVAWGANVIALNVFRTSNSEAACDAGQAPCTSASFSDIIAALEYLYSLRDSYSIAAANLSLGGGQFADIASCGAAIPSMETVLALIRSVGIAPVVASGNDGFGDMIGAPACAPSAISVTATTDGDAIANFANVYPEISLAAPGVSITSSVPGNATGTSQGTSMATPHVAGAFAVRQQAAPSSVDAALDAFIETATLVDDLRFGGEPAATTVTSDAELNSFTPVSDIPRINLDLAIDLPPTTFRIFNDGGPELNVASILPQDGAAWLSAVPAGPFSVGTGEVKIVKVNVDYELAPEGTSVKRMIITSDDPDDNPWPDGVDITVHTLSSEPEFDAQPSSLDFGNTEVGGQSSQETIVVQNLGGGPLTIGCSIPAENADDYLISDCPTPIAPATSVNVNLRCAPQELGAQDAVLVITSNDADEASNNIALNCVGITEDLISSDGFESE